MTNHFTKVLLLLGTFAAILLSTSVYAETQTKQSGDDPRYLIAKIHRIQKTLPAWIQKTGDAELVVPMLKNLDLAMKAKSLPNANKAADSILTLMSTHTKLDPNSLVAKMYIIQHTLPAWIQRTGRQAQVQPMMVSLNADFKANNFIQAHKDVDRILTLIAAK